MKRKNQLTDSSDNIKKVRFSPLRKRCGDDLEYYYEEEGGASDTEEYYDRRKKVKILNGYIKLKTAILENKNKNKNIPFYIN